jgi:hypothetical protein
MSGCATGGFSRTTQLHGVNLYSSIVLSHNSSPNEKSFSATLSKLATVNKYIQNLKNTPKTLSTTDLSRRRALAQQFTVTCEDKSRNACVTTAVSGQGTRGKLAVLYGAVRDNPPFKVV